MPSINDVSIKIVTDASQVGPAFQQVQRHFRQFQQETATGMKQVGGIAQQAVFAVDDFVASFSTGGVAGGIRGAANNLTMIASMLGGIKVQLAAIGVIAVGQLIASQFSKAKDAAKDAGDAIDFLKDRMQKFQTAQKQSMSFAELQDRRTGGTGEIAGNARQIAAVAAERAQRMQDLLTYRGKSIPTSSVQKLENLGIIDPSLPEEIQKEFRAIRDLDNELKHLRKTQDELISQQEHMSGLAAARNKTSGLGFTGYSPFSFITGEHIANMKREAAGLDAQIAELRQSLLPTFGVSELFRRFPSANAMGSVGAVSAINSAQFGPQNMQNTLVREAQETNRVLKRIEELEKKKGSLEVVPIP